MTKIIAHDRDGNNIELDSSELTFRPSVYGILIEDGKILLSKQWDGYDLPGGGMNIHETIEDTLKREFWEETGLKVRMGELVHAQTSFFTNNKDKKWNCILLYYLCKKSGGELSADNLDEEEKKYADMPEWISLDKLKGKIFYNSVDNIALIEKARKLL